MNDAKAVEQPRQPGRIDPTAAGAAPSATEDGASRGPGSGSSESLERVSERARPGELGEVLAQMNRLSERLEERLTTDRFKERQLARLHDELQAHRQGLLEKALRPLLMGLVRLHDELGRERDRLASTGLEAVSPAGRVAGLLGGFQDDVELLLEQHGVSRSRSPDDRFDPRLQTAVATVATEDSAQVGVIARRVRAGFEQNGTPLRKERVEVFVAAGAGRQAGAPETVPANPNASDEEEPR